MNLCGFIPESINEGKGVRAVLFISGCRHACPGCFNKESWDFEAGEPFTNELKTQILQEIANNPLIDGVTLCGGDPFFSAEECALFVSEFRACCPDKNVWAYTGYTFEALMRQSKLRELALMCDVIVDGRFNEQEKDTSFPFRGSRNQRIVDVALSVEKNCVIEVDLS